MTPATLVRIIDGDTVSVFLDGKEEPIRLIGVDAPEMDTEEGKRSLAYAMGYFARSLNDRVFLEFDQRQRCPHGRLRAYLWLEQPYTGHPVENNNCANFALLFYPWNRFWAFDERMKYKILMEAIDKAKNAEENAEERKDDGNV